MDKHYFMPLIFIVYVATRIFGYSNDIMLNAVLLSGKLDSDTQAAKQLNREQYNANRSELKLEFRTIRR